MRGRLDNFYTIIIVTVVIQNTLVAIWLKIQCLSVGVYFVLFEYRTQGCGALK